MLDSSLSVTRPYYRDVGARWLGVPVITVFGYYLTYNNIQLNWLLIYELGSDALKILCVWQAVRGSIRWLDSCYPWQRSLVGRLARQLLLTCLVGSAVLTGLVQVEYAFIRPYPLEHYWDFDLVIALVFMLLVNTLYVGLYYYDQYQHSQAQYQQSEAARQALATKLLPAQADTAAVPPVAAGHPAHLVVRLGRRELVVPHGDICCCYSAGKETYLLTLGHKQYLLDQSLDRLAEQLPPTLFFRANRQFVLASGAVIQVQPAAHGKLLAQLTVAPGLPAHITVSRDRAASFRRWLRGAPAGPSPHASSLI